MSAYRPDDAPPGLRRRDLAPRTSGRGNRSAARPVVQVVGKSRAFVAAVVAAGVVLSGCASADGGEDKSTTTTTSPAAAEEPGNPWDLPIEQRPALFDPCAEIPVEAVEEGVGAPVQIDEGLRNHEPNQLFTCGWETDEVLFGIISTWRPKSDFISDSGFGPVDTDSSVHGRPGFRASDKGREKETCYQIMFTSRGAVLVNLNLRTSLRTFRGERPWEACEVLDQTIGPVLRHLPEGNF